MLFNNMSIKIYLILHKILTEIDCHRVIIYKLFSNIDI